MKAKGCDESGPIEEVPAIKLEQIYSVLAGKLALIVYTNYKPDYR